VHANAALRELNRDAARHHLRLHDIEASHTQWLSAPPLHAAILSTAAILWDDPEHALAQFDSLVPGLLSEDGLANPWSRLLLRCRAELLLALGAATQAERIILRLTPADDGAVSFVPAAWFDLCAGRLSDALAKADDGIFESRISLADRAFLYAVKSAALQLAGAADELVGSAATAACVTCERAGTLVPFAVLPGAIRGRLITDHGKHHDDDRCYLSRAVHSGAFDQLRNAKLDVPTVLRLTRREEVLLPLLATAASVPEIANQQFVSVNTLRKQVVTLRQKFGAASRDDLVRKAHEAGLLNRKAKSSPRMDSGQPLLARAGF
jgi:DNA-binding CsgD family transcriptional regulator